MNSAFAEHCPFLKDIVSDWKHSYGKLIVPKGWEDVNHNAGKKVRTDYGLSRVRVKTGKTKETFTIHCYYTNNDEPTFEIRKSIKGTFTGTIDFIPDPTYKKGESFTCRTRSALPIQCMW